MSKLKRLLKNVLSIGTSVAIVLMLLSQSVLALSPIPQPDLTVQDIFLDGATLNIKVANTGVVNADPSINGYTYIWVDDMISPRWTYNWMTLNKSFLKRDGFLLMKPMNLYGEHTVMVCVDNSDLVAESDEFNNCRTETIGQAEEPVEEPVEEPGSGPEPVVIRPDLTVTRISRDVDSNRLDIKLTNLGNGPVENDNARVYVHVDNIQRVNHNFRVLTNDGFMEQGGSGTFQPLTFGTFPLTANVSHKIRVCVDATSLITESNEHNNCLTQHLTYTEALPELIDLKVSDIRVEGSNNILTVDVRGYGDVELPHTTNGHTYIYVDNMSSPRWTYNWSSLSNKNFLNGHGQHAQIQPSALGGGEHTIKACVDALNAVEESDEDNNCRTEVVHVEVEDNNGDTVEPEPAPSAPTSGADLIVTNVSFVSIKDNEYRAVPYEMHVTVKNQGTEAAYTNYPSTGMPIWIQNTADENERWMYEWFSGKNDGLMLSPGHFKTYTYTFDEMVFGQLEAEFKNMFNEGYNAYEVIVDKNFRDIDVSSGSHTNGVVNESNENNNSYSTALHIDSGSSSSNNNSGNSSGPIGLEYDVEISSSPAATYVSRGKGEIKVKKGDTVVFTRKVDSGNSVNGGWVWNFDKHMLGCEAFPDFDSPTFRCTVKKEGIGKVSITMYPVTADGVQHKVHSNTIYVTTKDPDTFTPFNGTVTTGTNSSSNNANIDLPPAGFENDVNTGSGNVSNPFSDTNTRTLAGKAAASLYHWGIIGGFPDGQFKGARSVNRAEAAKFLLLSRYESVPNNSNSGVFRDVLDGEWYTKYVMTAAALHIINGYADGTFKPADTVNTAEFLKMLTLTFDLQQNMSHSFTDVPRGDWYAKYAGIANTYNLFPDRGNRLEPARELTRNEVAVAIYNYLSQR
jgi:hypothetical protein